MEFQYLGSDWERGEREAALWYPGQAPELREKWMQTRWGTPEYWHLDRNKPEDPAEVHRIELEKQRELINRHGTLASRYYANQNMRDIEAAEEWLALRGGGAR